MELQQNQSYYDRGKKKVLVRRGVKYPENIRKLVQKECAISFKETQQNNFCLLMHSLIMMLFFISHFVSYDIGP
jgi:hypothetical protein